jgi:demethylmenaquinone methyltransferase / 2-methoxy-6-polyprenyl-1,4-benzoquinol methylase
VSPGKDDTREMFSRIARRYDLVNTVLSLGTDGLWRRASVAPVLDRPGLVVLDACAGTGKLALESARAANRPRLVIASDFAAPMVEIGAARKPGPREAPGRYLVGDSEHLPLADASVDVYTCGFGVRNLVNLDAGLREAARVLRPGGRLLILEFLNPGERRWHRLVSWHVKAVLPLVGGLISGSRAAYAYLPASIDRFVTRQEMVARVEAVGFADVALREFMFGVVTGVTATRR